MGCSTSHDNDCNVYAIDGGGEFALIDSGCGIETGQLIENMKLDGIPLERVTLLLLTHGHLDHSGGARSLRDRLGLQIGASLAPHAPLRLAMRKPSVWGPLNAQASIPRPSRSMLVRSREFSRVVMNWLLVTVPSRSWRLLAIPAT